MKNLKKLSAAFMLAALFSSSLTSCIDNEVSPVVEAIYANQAELLAAQAAVQNANATLVLAQAAVQEANAANQEAITANFVATSAQALLAQIAATELAVEQARIAMLLAQAEFDQDLEQILAAIRTAQNLEAGQHAADYSTAMANIATLRGTRLTTQQSIAAKELYMKSIAAGTEMTWAVYLANLERDVLAKEASVIANEAYIVRANTYLGDYDAMVEALAVANAAVTAKQDEIDVLDAEDAQIDADILATTGNFDQFQTNFETMEGELVTLEGNLATQEANLLTLTTVTIPGLEATIADYAATTTTLEAAVAAAKVVIGSNAAGNHANNHATGSGLLLAIDEAGDDVTAATTALGTYGATGVYADSPRTGTLSAQDAKWNADLALLQHNTDFAALTATYNAAATALESAQAAFDASSYAADLQTAKDDRDDELDDRQDAIDAYDAAALAFAASTTGSVFADGPDTHANANIGYDDIDLGETGIHTDIAGDTYMRVDTWKETSIGSGLYVPASFYTTKYNAADLAAHITTIKADVVSADNLNILVDADVWVWEATGGGAMIVNNGAGALVTADDHALTSVEAALADSDNLAVFVNVELDDSSISNLYTFNTTTNMLGSDDFTTRPFFTSGAGTVASPYIFNGVLNPTTTSNSGYDSTPNVNGEANSAHDVLTAQAELWNAELEVFKKQNAFDLGDDALVAAQATFDAQEILFNDGLATRTTLEGTVTTATAGVTTATGVVTAATTAKTALEAELGVEYVQAAPVGTQVLRVTNTPANLPLSWDAHDNDGLTTPAFDILPSAGYDSDILVPTGGPVNDSLTAYAILWNAENALDIHTATSLTGYNTQLATAQAGVVTATNTISEIGILIVRKTADIAALQAEYDALVATPLYAAQQVRLLEIADEKAVLAAEKIVLQAEATALAITISFEGLGTIALIDAAIVTAQGIIDGAPAYYDLKAAQIALGELSVEDLTSDIAKLTTDLADLDARIAAKVVEADGYLALLNAALGN